MVTAARLNAMKAHFDRSTNEELDFLRKEEGFDKDLDEIWEGYYATKPLVSRTRDLTDTQKDLFND